MRPRRSPPHGRRSPTGLANSFPTLGNGKGGLNCKMPATPEPLQEQADMRDAVIVSTARTPIGRAYRGAFNATPSPTLAAHALRAAVERANVDAAEIDDCILGCSLPQGYQQTIGRMAALRAGLPVEVPGMTMDRQCSSGLMTIATAAKQIIVDRMDVVLVGGVEPISLVQTPELRVDIDPELLDMHDDAYMA